jgi:hypothetical protein
MQCSIYCKQSKPTILFSNYVPKDDNLSASATASNSDKQVPSSSFSQPPPPLLKQIKANRGENPPKLALELALAKSSQESWQAASQVKITIRSGWSSVTPVSSKKIYWDLKQDVAHKMEKLEWRMQTSIVELLKESLERESAKYACEDVENQSFPFMTHKSVMDTPTPQSVQGASFGTCTLVGTTHEVHAHHVHLCGKHPRVLTHSHPTKT